MRSRLLLLLAAALVATCTRETAARPARHRLSGSAARPSLQQQQVRRRQQLTVLAVGSALCSDVLLLLMLVPMLPYLLPAEEAASQLALSCLFSAKDACQLLMAPFMGMLTLRYGAQRTFTASLLGLAAATVAFAEARGFRALLVARALQGAASAALMSGGMTLVADSHAASERGEAIARAQTGLGVGAAAGPVLGGLLLESLGRRASFYVTAALVGVNGLLAMALEWLAPLPPECGSGAAAAGGGGGEPALRQLVSLLRSPPVALAVAGVAAQYAAGGLFDATFGVHVSEAFGLGPARASLAFALEPLTYLIALLRLAPHADRGGAARKPRLSALGLGLTALSLPVLSLGNRRASVGAALVLHGLGYALKDASGHALLADLVDSRGVGSISMAFALADVADSAGYILGPPLGAALTATRLGRTGGLAVCALGVLALVPPTARLRSQPRPRDGAKTRSVRSQSTPHAQPAALTRRGG